MLSQTQEHSLDPAILRYVPVDLEQLWAMEKSTKLGHRKGVGITDYICYGLVVCMNGTTSVPKSILHYEGDKVRLFVLI